MAHLGAHNLLAPCWSRPHRSTKLVRIFSLDMEGADSCYHVPVRKGF